MFSHEKIDAYQVGLEFVAWVCQLSKANQLEHCIARDELANTSHVIPKLIALGNREVLLEERIRFFETSCDKVFESATTIDILYRCGEITKEQQQVGKKLLRLLLSMVKQLVKVDCVASQHQAAYRKDHIDSRIDITSYEN
jgi:hypothetical protein